MHVTRITPLAPAAANAPAFDRTARLDAIRSDMRNAVAFTARAHHGWGGPDPTPVPAPTVPVPAPTVPAPTEPTVPVAP
jgi:hypothetical protein